MNFKERNGSLINFEPERLWNKMESMTFRGKANADLINFQFTENITEIETERLLTFYANEKLFAVPIESVMEIMELQPVTYLPKMPGYVKGITNVRGKILPVIELRLRLGYEEGIYDENTAMIIMDTNRGMIGYIVDNIGEVINVPKNEVVSVPQSGESTSEYVDSLVKTDSGIAFKLNLMKIIEE